MIVEMMGSPGAGKTSLLPVVREFFTKRGQAAYSVIEAARLTAARTFPGRLINRWLPENLRYKLLWQVFYTYARRYRTVFAHQYPKLMDSVLIFQRQRPILKADRRYALHWFIHLTGVVAFMNDYLAPDEVLIVDEGFVHRVVQLFASEKEEPNYQQITKYLGLIPKPDLIVYVSTSEELSAQRVFERGLWKRWQTKSEADARLYLTNAQAVVQFTASYLKNSGWPMIEVSNSGQPIETSRSQLVQALSAWMNLSQELIPV